MTEGEKPIYDHVLFSLTLFHQLSSAESASLFFFNPLAALSKKSIRSSVSIWFTEPRGGAVYLARDTVVQLLRIFFAGMKNRTKALLKFCFASISSCTVVTIVKC